MRIESSSVQMAGSSTSIEQHTKEESLKTWIGNARPVFSGEKPINLFLTPVNPQGDTLELSPEGRAALEKKLAEANGGQAVEEDELSDWISDKDKQKLLMLERMLESLTGKKIKFLLPERIYLDKSKLEQLKTQAQDIRLNRPPVRVVRPQGWGLEYDLHESYYEKQAMTFSAEGTVKTADGKEIKFDLDLSMSREFASRLDLSVRAGDAVRVDPLVINFNAPAAKLTGSKFQFDLDNDGDDEQISFATGGSGFLAYDANGDGRINNGSELFGPNSGNGFTDLGKYDGDGNGWIDENDDIYSKLRIWTKDENGNDQLFALGEKGIGAIYLGNVATAFDMKTNSNQTLGSIANTGIYLRENGTAGTIQHVDLVV